jgi:ATPase subunit of ABC transporter with duplicated ATPase domains
VGAIDVNGVACRTPGGVALLRDVSFGVGDGEHVALVGANGVGKTTLFRVVAGDQAPDGGSVHVDVRRGSMDARTCDRGDLREPLPEEASRLRRPEDRAANVRGPQCGQHP